MLRTYLRYNLNMQSQDVSSERNTVKIWLLQKIEYTDYVGWLVGFYDL